MRYYDTSALVKRYIIEPGRSEVVLLTEADRHPCTGVMSGAEVPSALAQAMRLGRLGAEQAAEMCLRFQREWRQDYTFIALDRELASEAGDLAWRHGLRGFDAAHLACAREVGRLYGEPVTLVTFDRRLWQAARAEGLDVFPADLGGVH